MILSARQKSLIERVVNVFETGKVGDYATLTILADGPKGARQITYGRSQTTEHTKLGEVLQRYVKAKGKYSSQLAGYVAKIGKTPLVDDKSFAELLSKAGREDPAMARVQDEVFDTFYFAPALDWARRSGFTQALSMLVIYDSYIHSGRMPKLLCDGVNKQEKPPSAGGDEKRWISLYVEARHAWLSGHKNKLLHKTVYRVDCFKQQIELGNWELSKTPIVTQGVKVGPAVSGDAA